MTIRMSAIIPILQLGVVITLGFTVSSDDHTSAGPNLNLECFNNYLTEMVCSLTSDSCSEYSLNVSRNTEFFRCDLKRDNSSRACECLIKVDSGFVLGEVFQVQVLKGKNLLFTKSVSTTKSIKPKKPFNVSVKQTQHGNFNIIWNTEYQTEEHIFSLDLISELTYYIEGSKIQKTVTVSPRGRFEYELIGRNLESNSNYLVKARIKSPLNDRFSDYSHAVQFTTSTSPIQVLKIIILVVCIMLIASILIIYYSCNKIQSKWWDKISTPKIASSIVKQVPQLLLTQSDFLPDCLDSLTLVQTKDTVWPASCPVNIKSENSLDKDVHLSEVTLIQSLEANTCENNRCFIECQSTSNQMPVSNHCKNLNTINCGRKCADFSNLPFEFHNLSLKQSASPEIAFSASEKDLILMKNEGFENTIPSPDSTPSSDSTVVHGYQSVINLQDSAFTHQEFISSLSNDGNLIPESICKKNTQNISCESPVLSVDNEYKYVQSLPQNSEKQQEILIKDLELEQLWGRDFHSSTGIEIDCSYHSV